MTILNGGGSSGVSPKNFNQGIEDVKSAVQNVQSSVNSLSSTMQSGMSNLQDSVEEMQTAVQNVPAGPLPCPASLGYAKSVEDGIEVQVIVLEANVPLYMKEEGLGLAAHPLSMFAAPKGIMVRYSTEGYPLSESEGELAFVVENARYTSGSDVPDRLGVVQTVTGLTNGEKYYFSAFTYGYNGLFNNVMYGHTTDDTSLSNYTTCSYTGNKGTLTVDVTQDYDYKTLGEFTATLTPSSGSAKTQTRTGPGNVVFAGLDAGTYTLSFSAETYFTTPASQQITITAGQPNTTSAEYKLSAMIADYSWSEIKQISDSGKGEEMFSIGDVKSVRVTSLWVGIDRTHTTNPETRDEQEIDVDAVVVAINHYENEDGSHNNIVFCTKKTVVTAEVGYGTCCWVANGGGETHFSDYMKRESTISKILPEVSGLLKTVKLPTCYYAGNSSSGNLNAVENCKMFPPSFSEVGGVSGNLVGDGTKYPYFSNNENRKMKSVSGFDTAWVTRTTARNGSYSPAFCGVKADGTLENIYDATIGDGSMPICFCI